MEINHNDFFHHPFNSFMHSHFRQMLAWQHFMTFGLDPRSLAHQYEIPQTSADLKIEQSKQTQMKAFHSHPQPCIVIGRKKEPIQKKLKQHNNDSSSETKPTQKKVPQKETRNVLSNLLRIFLKHVIELKFFDTLIEKILLKHSDLKGVSGFHTWLQKFNINFKNYIKLRQIKRVLGKNQPEVYKRVFMMLAHRYAEDVGLSHCLTSRRIEPAALKMHIAGLQELRNMIDDCYRQQQ